VFPLNWLYGFAIFLGSFLLFLVEPMAARRLLPRLGGSAAVWVTCLIFFQSALLLGYLAAHAVATRLRPRAQIAIYGVLLLLCLGQTLAISNLDLHASTAHPILSVFWLLGALIGLPFTVLSMNAPLLQAWHSAHAGAGSSSYKLYALSNLGSLLALAAYPLLLEPRLGLHAQATLWRAGLVLFIVICAVIFTRLWNFRQEVISVVSADASLLIPASTETSKLRNPETWKPVFLWLLLAACGSWLLCAITNHLNQDVAAVPLLWMLPLIAYLLSFVWTFSGERFYPRKWILLLMPLLLAALGYLLYQTDLTVGRGWLVFFFCVALLLCCVLCHGELYRRRPAPARLTAFYLTVAAGGMLGSIFVGIIAPVVFAANYELGGALVFLALLLLVLLWRNGTGWRLLWSATLVVVAILAVRQVLGERADAIAQARSFYGSLRILELPAAAANAPNQRTRALFHGTVLHGAEYFAGPQAATPFYGSNTGPAMAIDFCCPNRSRRIGVIGLGAGSLAAYAHSGDTIRFYEIDPLIVKMARDYFTYMRASPAKVEVVLGDGRISLSQELANGTSQNFDVLAIDAFSGGAIPVHLLTREAIELYRRHLRPGGILAINITNVYLDLAPIVAAQAVQAGLQARYFESDVSYPGGYVVDWILLTDNRDFLARPEIQRGLPISTRANLRLWTDDYNSLFPVFSLRRQE
jgi:predicted membrane-bound spermidine synthase